MRSKDFGMIPDVSREFSREETLEMYRKICTVREFEFQVKKYFDQGLVRPPIYLSIGQEAGAAALSVAYSKSSIFAQHRAHDLYLSYDGDPAALADELLGLPTGIAHGMGGSASIHSPAIGMYGHSGLMGDQIPVSVGFALGSGKNVLAVMGDASAEEDYVLGAMGYASTKKAPVLFVCIDNGLSILTKVKVRRSWAMADVAKSFGMEAVEIADDPWLVMHHARALVGRRPAFINIHTARNVWHSGSGNDGEPEWDRFALVTEEMVKLRLAKEAATIQEEAKQSAAKLWEERVALSVSPVKNSTT
jgi:pyruvate dehydrogenase E1 component alpha subunit